MEQKRPHHYHNRRIPNPHRSKPRSTIHLPKNLGPKPQKHPYHAHFTWLIRYHDGNRSPQLQKSTLRKKNSPMETRTPQNTPPKTILPPLQPRNNNTRILLLRWHTRIPSKI